MNKFEAILKIRGMKKKELEELLVETYIFDSKSKINALHCYSQASKHIAEINKYLSLMELFLTEKNFNFQFTKLKEEFNKIIKKIDEIDLNQTKYREEQAIEIKVIE